MVLGKSFTNFQKDLQNNQYWFYPNPASKETNVQIDFLQPRLSTLKMFDAAGSLS